MIYVFVIIAFILAWFFIEITLFLVKINFISFNKTRMIQHRRFLWRLRIIALSLLLLTSVYMYYFKNEKFLEAVEYCLGIIK